MKPGNILEAAVLLAAFASFVLSVTLYVRAGDDLACRRDAPTTPARMRCHREHHRVHRLIPLRDLQLRSLGEQGRRLTGRPTLHRTWAERIRPADLSATGAEQSECEVGVAGPPGVPEL
ncbi:MAG: hypothetical protein RJB61_1509 [Actinomycetota bacterium]